ncbi:MAG: carbon monoxide dehydrogenase, partial [Thermodesulfobacteria bacterium]|nr:carbon monoxide dehydrogenase [Thermodesulfobacteriota bacterium]
IERKPLLDLPAETKIVKEAGKLFDRMLEGA